MARAPRQVGDRIVIGAVDGTTSLKKYDLVPAQNNYSYTVESEEDVRPGQQVSVPITFHGGLPEARYDPVRSPGPWYATGLITERPNYIYATPIVVDTTLTGAANPPMYYFEEPVGDSGADDGEFRIYAIAQEAAETNVYKVSEDQDNFGTLLNTRTISTTPTQPCGQPAKWNNGSNTRWYHGNGDNDTIERLDAIASGTSNDTWTAAAAADARLLQVVGNRLMRSTNENQVSLLPRAGDPLTEASWGSDFFVGEVSAQITALGEAGGLAYVAKEDGFYEWDTVGQPVNIFPEIGFAPRNGQGMKYWHGGFMIPAKSGLWWTRTGSPVGPDSNPNSLNLNLSTGIIETGRNGRWGGVFPYGKYLFAIYQATATNSVLFAGVERDTQLHPPGWGPLVWHVVASYAGDLNDFSGCHVSERSEANPGVVTEYPYVWFPKGDNLSHQQRDHDGSPFISYAAQSNLDSGTQVAYASDIDFGFPRVLKQFRKVDGFSEALVTGHAFQIKVGIDGNSIANLGSALGSSDDGYWERFFTQDSSDTGRYLTLGFSWSSSGDITDVTHALLKDIRVHAVLLPDTAQVWTFNFWVADGMVKTAKKLRSELEAFLQDLKQYELPDGDKINGVMTGIRLLRADEIRDLFPDMQPPAKYILQATVREMVSS
ncbi:MAG: hypothetical protein V3U27_21530 [Candidatus Tectomicrobia bacterium]